MLHWRIGITNVCNCYKRSSVHISPSMDSISWPASFQWCGLKNLRYFIIKRTIMHLEITDAIRRTYRSPESGPVRSKSPFNIFPIIFIFHLLKGHTRKRTISFALPKVFELKYLWSHKHNCANIFFILVLRTDCTDYWFCDLVFLTRQRLSLHSILIFFLSPCIHKISKVN